MILEDSNLLTVYNKHKLLQSGNSSNIDHMVVTLPIGLLFLVQWHNTCKVTNSATRIIQEPISAVKIVRTLPIWDKHITVLWDYVKKYWHLHEIIVLHFMLLQLSFRLWIWHREPHLLSSLPYLFIVIYAVLFHDQKLKVSLYNCSRSSKFNICGPECKICVYIENGFFPRFFETYYITVCTVVEKYVILNSV